MAGTYLKLSGIRHKYNGRVVVGVDSLAVNLGEALGIIGPNGSGKSTLLRLVGLLERPEEGGVFFDDADVWSNGGVLKRRRKMAAVFQEPLLFKGTVFDNVAYGLKLRGTFRNQIKEKVRTTLEWLSIEHLAFRPADQLSGGEAQRVSLARAMVLEPDLLLLDEPLASLDAPTKASLLSDLREILTKPGLTSVYVTHNRAEALALTDRLAVMLDGRVAQVGAPRQVFSAPADKRVAELVGVETILPGKVKQTDKGLAVIQGDGFEIEAISDSSPGEEVLVCIRPEEVSVSTKPFAGPHSARNKFSGKVSSLVSEGPVYRVTVDCGFRLASFVTGRSLEEMDIDVGRDVWVSFKATGIHVIKHRSR